LTVNIDLSRHEIKSPSKAILFHGSVSWIKYEPFFGKIPTPNSDCPPPAAAGRKKLKTTAQAQKILRGRGGKKIFCALAF